jgi:hypothetical protein
MLICMGFCTYCAAHENSLDDKWFSAEALTNQQQDRLMSRFRSWAYLARRSKKPKHTVCDLVKLLYCIIVTICITYFWFQRMAAAGIRKEIAIMPPTTIERRGMSPVPGIGPLQSRLIRTSNVVIAGPCATIPAYRASFPNSRPMVRYYREVATRLPYLSMALLYSIEVHKLQYRRYIMARHAIQGAQSCSSIEGQDTRQRLTSLVHACAVLYRN